MNENSGTMCRIPVKATMQYVNGVMTMLHTASSPIQSVEHSSVFFIGR